MSWSIEVVGDFDPKEPIVGMCCCEGNLALATEKVGYKKLPHIESKEIAMEAIVKVIHEIDKGNEGLFNDDWCVECDKHWSEGREMNKAWNKWEPLFSRIESGELNLPFHDKKTYWGNHIRTELRSSAVRFYLYYKAGFEVTFEW